MRQISTRDIIRKTFNDFSRNTSLHGMSYTGDSKMSSWEKIFWGFAITCVSFSAFYLTALHLKRFASDPMRSTIVTNYAPTDSIYFPAVTICNTNRILESKIYSFIDKLDLADDDDELLQRALPQLIGFFRRTTINYTDLIRMKQILDRNDYFYTDLILRKIGPSCKEMLIQCKWNEELVDCMTIFEETYTLDGHCCSFNYFDKSRYVHRIAYNYEKSKPNATTFTGWHSGLTLTMNPMVQKMEYSAIHSSGIKCKECRNVSMNFSGKYVQKTTYYVYVFDLRNGMLQVHIHNSFEYPAFGTSSKIASPGYTYFFQIIATKLINTENVNYLTPEQRQCTFSYENPLMYHRYYYFSNCMVEYSALHLFEACGCVFFYYTFSDMPKCNLTDIPCIQIHFKVHDSMDAHDLNCPARCDVVMYRVHSTNTKLNNVSQALTDENKNKIPEREGIRVNVFFIKTHTIMSRDVYTTNLNLISSIGGIYGLFMGCSIITILEMIYYCSLRIFVNLGWVRKSRKKPKGGENQRPSVIQTEVKGFHIYGARDIGFA